MPPVPPLRKPSPSFVIPPARRANSAQDRSPWWRGGPVLARGSVFNSAVLEGPLRLVGLPRRRGWRLEVPLAQAPGKGYVGHSDVKLELGPRTAIGATVVVPVLLVK
jgi:hypothetical protein